MAGRFVPPIYSPNNDDGSANLPGALLYFYVNGSSTTLQDTYSDFALTTPHTNPVVADGDGRFAQIFGNGTYSAKMTDADGNNVWGPYDDITLASDGSVIVDDANNTSAVIVQTLTHTSTATAGDGMGALQAFAVENDAGETITGGTHGIVATDVSDGTEDYKWTWGLIIGGAAIADKLELTGTALYPTTSDGLALGIPSTNEFSDLFGASGFVWNIANGNYTVTHTSGQLAFSGIVQFASLKGTGSTTVTNILDEDDMASDSNTALSTQQAIKAYVLARGKDLVLDERTGNTILGTTDPGKLISITSGTFTQTFEAAATLGSDWVVYYKNSGTGDVTLDPDGAEQIDGLTSFIMYPGEARIIQCDGTKFTTILLEGFKRTYTSTDTFTTPPGYSAFGGLLWSAGGSGAGSSGGADPEAGGAGGGCYPFEIESSLFGATETITIGAGGTAVVASAGNVDGNDVGS